MQTETSFLEVSNINKQLGDVPLLHNISFKQLKYQKLAIMGETGSGKTTLMKIIGGLEQADSGTVTFKGKRVKGKYEQLIPGHPGIAYLSQYFELRNHYWVYELLSYANELSDDDANNLYKLCQIDHLVQRRTDQLSGGEKQRIALTLLLTKSPKFLLLDEPFSNLDMIHKNILKSAINDIGKKLGITSMLISHDPLDILSWADELLIIKDGTIIQQGSPLYIYNHPVNEYAAGLLGKYNLINKKTAAQLGIQTDNESIFIRPEALLITTENLNSINGVIKSITYYGSYYDIEAETNKMTLTIRTTDNNWKINDTINITGR